MNPGTLCRERIAGSGDSKGKAVLHKGQCEEQPGGLVVRQRANESVVGEVEEENGG